MAEDVFKISGEAPKMGPQCFSELHCTARGVAGREAATEQCRILSSPTSFLPPLQPAGKSSMATLQACRITTGTPAPTEEML